jgi:hypothetical protein
MNVKIEVAWKAVPKISGSVYPFSIHDEIEVTRKVEISLASNRAVASTPAGTAISSTTTSASPGLRIRHWTPGSSDEPSQCITPCRSLTPAPGLR